MVFAPSHWPPRNTAFPPFLRNVSIRSKLLLAFAVIVLLSGGVAVLALSINLEIRTDISQIKEAATDRAEAVSTMAESLLALQLHRQELISERMRMEHDAAAGTSREKQIAKLIETSIQQFEKDGLEEARKGTIELLQTEERQGHADEIDGAREELSMLEAITAQFSSLKKDLEDHLLSPGAGSPSAEDIARRSQKFSAVSGLVENYEAYMKDDLKRDVDSIQRSLRNSNRNLLLFALVVLALSTFLTWYISQKISRPIGLLADSAQRIGRGNLQTVVELPSRTNLDFWPTL